MITMEGYVDIIYEAQSYCTYKETGMQRYQIIFPKSVAKTQIGPVSTGLRPFCAFS